MKLTGRLGNRPKNVGKNREEILKNWPDCFKETLEKGDRIKHPPVKIKLKENSEIPPHIAVARMTLPFTSGKPTLKSSRVVLMPEYRRSVGKSPVSGPARPFRW